MHRAHTELGPAAVGVGGAAPAGGGACPGEGGGGRDPMGRVRKKKPLVEPPMKSRKRARRVTSAYHRVTAALAAEAAAAGAGPAAQATRQALERELEALGGVQVRPGLRRPVPRGTRAPPAG